MDRTLMIIKPAAVKKNAVGDIIRRVEEKGFVVRELRMLSQTKEQARAFYAVHRERPFYEDLVDFIVGRICDQLEIENNCITRWGCP